MKLVELREKYRRGEISKPEYVAEMHRLHWCLSDYRKLIADCDLTELKIDDAGLTARLNSPSIVFRFDLRDTRSAALDMMNFGAYEPDERRFLLKLAATATTILDIGANIGLYSLLLAVSRPESKIHAFEPVPDTYRLLKGNLELNRIENVVTHQIGLGAETGEHTFFHDPEYSVRTSLRDVAESGRCHEISCRVRRLDDVVAESHLSPDLIKCDVEGGEFGVFRGAQETLLNYRPAILTEMLRKWSRAFGYHPNDLIAYLGEYGYRCFSIRESQLHAVAQVDESTAETNFVFLHREVHSKLTDSFLVKGSF